MIARRLTALLLSLLTLNVTVLGADSSCAKHATAKMAMAHMSPATAAVSISAAIGDKGDQHTPCEVPSESNCCRALASCSVSFENSESVVSSTSMHLRELIASGVSTTPLSEIVTPDPPPPKA